MNKKKLLICIAYHYDAHNDYVVYLKQVLVEFLLNYRPHLDLDIIVDTNCLEGAAAVRSLYPDEMGRTIRVEIHSDLQHPFHLTWMHRAHFQKYIDSYDVFMYTECDLRLPYENYENYMENFEMIWPRGVPVLFRVEFNPEGVMHSSEAEVPVRIKRSDVVEMGGKRFVHKLPHPFPYMAMWICPRKVLKPLIGPDFVKATISRETAASFLIWELRKMGYMQIEKDLVSPKVHIYHLPSNYAMVKGRLGQIKADDAIRVVDD